MRAETRALACVRGGVCVYECVCTRSLTQHDEVDLAPVVPAAGLDFAGVLARVALQQVADEQRGVAAQVLAGEGQAAGIVAVGGVHLAVEEGDDLRDGEDGRVNGQLPAAVLKSPPPNLWHSCV